MRCSSFLMIVVFLVSGRSYLRANEILYSLDYSPHGAHAPAYAPDGLQLVIEFPSPSSPGLIERLGSGVRWDDGSSGSHDCATSDSPEAADLASVLTNGADDLLLLMTYDESYGGSGHGRMESSWGFGDPDLAGNQIDLIRLVVHDLSIQLYNPGPPYGEGLQWNGHITWEFWGEPIPEPATLALLALSLLVVRHRRSAHRRG